MPALIARQLGTLGSGEIVVDRPRNSHVESHRLPDGLLAQALAQIDSAGRAEIVEEVTFPEAIGLSARVLTRQGDDILYARRQNRRGFTRFVRNRRGVRCRTLVVVLVKTGHMHGRVAYVAITAFIGVKGLPEPWDWNALNKAPDLLLAALESQQYWSNHALVWGCEPVDAKSVTRKCPWQEQEETS